MKRLFTQFLLAAFGLALLASCSQTQELASREKEAPRYRKVYYKNKIIIKDRESDRVKLDLQNAQVADYEEETPEIIVPLASAVSEKKTAERPLMADRSTPKIQRSPSFGNVFGALADRNAPDRADRQTRQNLDVDGETGLLLAGIGSALIVIAYLLAFLTLGTGSTLALVLYIIGGALVLVGGAIWVIDYLL